MEDSVSTTPVNLDYPDGLAIARVAEALVEAALAEVQPHLQGDSGSLPSAMFEVGLSYSKTTRACALRRAAPLADLPYLRALLEAASVSLGGPADLRERQLNVICRRYLPGHGLEPHRDLPEMIEEDIYGCVLSNTSWLCVGIPSLTRARARRASWWQRGIAYFAVSLSGRRVAGDLFPAERSCAL
ncbi:unnamed protein product [Polarella glacialis]|uniref:Uncharacterized protein n=1 Tax=Polarella glacialis TaxID=89957 RepID=A0A813JX03_POLGL|nr:unnamed protein product [Polarella glacialis]